MNTYEGYSLDCEGGYCDCPHYCADDPYGTHEDDGPYAASASVSFSSPAVIFEDAYTNRPGVVVARQSTRTTLTCTAHGGEKGITVSFSIVGDGKLVRISTGTLPITRFVPPQQKLEFEIEYEGHLPSGAEEDIVATATMTGEDVQPTTVTDELTSVKLELRAVYEAPENPNPTRHLYGVGELVEFEVCPKISTVWLQAVKSDATDCITFYDTFGGAGTVDASSNRVFRCPATDTRPNITVRCAGVEYEPKMTVIEPQVVLTPDASGSGSFVPGDVGMGCLTTRNYIGPKTVSFQGVYIYEVPCTNAIPPEGYFATNYTGRLVHDYYAGAGNLHIPGTDNYWMTDDAGRDAPYDNWYSGRLVWRIPVGWRRIVDGASQATVAPDPDHERYIDKKSRPLYIGNSEDSYRQTYVIESDGTASVEKYGHKLTRGRWSIWGVVTEVE